jgi:hypothetical protein
MGNSGCPICEASVQVDDKPTQDWLQFACPRCGTFQMTWEALDLAGPLVRREAGKAMAVSHVIRRMGDARVPRITSELLTQIAETARLPSLPEAADNLLLYVGNRTRLDLKFEEAQESLQSRIGAASLGHLHTVVDGLTSHVLARGGFKKPEGASDRSKETVVYLGLTIDGWRRFEELHTRVIGSRRAFMAMAFANKQLADIFERHFVPAIAQTGFDLRRATDGQKAGLIDDMMRVDIRNSRFLIADLSDENNGAYWEAGFAEGLGRPVIYTCRKDIFEGDKTRPHFDTNHHVTVPWDPENIEAAVTLLKNTVRATLPGEAKMTDE